jgi:hypothetical protein
MPTRADRVVGAGFEKEHSERLRYFYYIPHVKFTKVMMWQLVSMTDENQENNKRPKWAFKQIFKKDF